MISYGRQYLDRNAINSVVKSLKNNLITQGPEIKKFESSLKNKFGSNFCCVVSSGTAALHLSGNALGWKKNDVILTSPIGFLASANSVIYNGAKPDFVDIDLKTYNIDPKKIIKKIEKYKKLKKKITAIIAVDYGGFPCDWKALKKISKKYKIQLVNDNCHAIGAKFNGDIKYACKYADVVTHSYHPVKSITTGEGGSVLTNNKKVYEKIKLLRSHGILKNFSKEKLKKTPWLYEMSTLGYNYRITDFQCALGSSQLKKLEKFIIRRNKIASIYDGAFKNINGFIIPPKRKKIRNAYHLYPLLIDFKKMKVTKSYFFNKLKEKNIHLQVHYTPIHTQPFYKKKFGFKKKAFPNSLKFYEKSVSLPIYYGLKDKEIYKIIKYIKKITGVK